MRLKRLRFPALLVSIALVGAFAGLALAQDPGPSDEIEASAEQIDCASFDMSAAEEAQVEDCWSTELTGPAPPGADEVEIALAKQVALCDAVGAVEAPPEFCSMTAEPADAETTSP